MSTGDGTYTRIQQGFPSFVLALDDVVVGVVLLLTLKRKAQGTQASEQARPRSD